MKKIKKLFFVEIILAILMLVSIDKVYSANTDYFDKDKNKEEEIGVAVIKKDELKEVYSYFYLYYDSNGEVHIVQYIENPLLSEVEKAEEQNKNPKKWILKTDADNLKAKELGAKEYYTDEESIKKDENKEATKLYKKIAKEKDSRNSLYDYIEGTEEDLEPYTIESIIFNEIPLFDANVFKDTAGGKAINEDSIVGIIRKLVAVWYYSFRNIALVVLAMLVIYYGIRMAISTVASDKAVYKEMLLGWFKSLVLILVIHIIMYVILSANDYLVGIFKTINEDEGKIYNTIKTRALELPWKISIPATIMYISLLIMWLRFLWTYIKRTFSIIFLIILAPLVLIKYAYESASGKGSRMVSNLIQRFATTVFIQSIHALIYVVFVRTALEIALDDLHGFIIALFFLNFILAADKIFIDIFKFEFDSKQIGEMKKPFKLEKEFVGVYVTYGIAKNTVGFVSGVGKPVAGYIGNQANKAYIKHMDHLDDEEGGHHRTEIRDKVTGALNKADDFALGALQKYDENGRPIPTTGLRQDAIRILRLRKLSRVRGMTGARAKKLLKIKRTNNRRRYNAPFKLIKDIGMGTVETILAIPVGVSNPTGGVIMASNAIHNFSRSSSTIRSSVERRRKGKKTKEQKYDRYLDHVLSSIRTIDDNSNFIVRRFGRFSDDEKELGRQQLQDINELDINQYNLSQRINDYIRRNRIQELDEDTIRAVVDEIVGGLPDTITDEQKQTIKDMAFDSIQRNRLELERVRRQNMEGEEQPDHTEQPGNTQQEETRQTEENSNNNNGNNNNTQEQRETQSNSSAGNSSNTQRNGSRYSIQSIAESIEDAVIETRVDNKFVDAAKALNKMKDANDREQGRDDTNGSIIRINRFIENL